LPSLPLLSDRLQRQQKRHEEEEEEDGEELPASTRPWLGSRTKTWVKYLGV